MSELIVGVVPIRSLHEGKTRLSAILTPDERAAFMRRSGEQVIRSALDSRVVDTVIVVSPDPAALDWSARLGARVKPLLQPEGQPGLNGAMNAARDWALERDADRLFSLFADLPLLTMYDVRLLTSRRDPLVLGPDRKGEGTNAMLLDLQGAGATFQFAFGADSLRKHLAEAERLGLKAAVQTIPGIGFDLDTPLDWADYHSSGARQEDLAPREPVLTTCGAKGR